MTRRKFLRQSAGTTALAVAAGVPAVAWARTVALEAARARVAGSGPIGAAGAGAAGGSGGGMAMDGSGVAGGAPAAGTSPVRDLTAAEFAGSRRFVATRYGRIAVVERGAGPAAAIFMHGLPLNGFQWRGVLPRLASERRCIAPDFLGLGYTETPEGQDLSPATQAEMIAALLDALSLDQVDVVANDSGGGVAQLFAARHPARVRTLLLTNCDTHTNSPPPAVVPVMELARQGRLADFIARNIADRAFARSPEGLGGITYTRPENLTDEAIEYYLTPLVSSPARRAQFHGYLLAFEPNPLPAIEPLLKRSPIPVRIVWGTGDKHFDAIWAEWLDRTFPKSRGVRRVEGANLFFPEEYPDLIAEEARALWASAPPRRSGARRPAR